jgi:hypothetical protein
MAMSPCARTKFLFKLMVAPLGLLGIRAAVRIRLYFRKQHGAGVQLRAR